MIHAQQEEVPKEVVEFFKSPGNAEEPDRFMQLLADWYRDSEESVWLADWADFHFPDRAFFASTSFLPDADFSGATFEKKLVFVGTSFRGAARFSNSIFNEGLHAYGFTRFGETDFAFATFRQDAIFHDVEFEEKADFSHAAFQALAIRQVTLHGDGVFRGATFSEGLHLEDVAFGADADFTRTSMARLGFDVVAVAGEVRLEPLLDREGSAILSRVGRDVVRPDRPPGPRRLAVRRPGESLEVTGPAAIRMSGLSLGQVELRSLDASELRLRGSRDAEKLTWLDVRWPQVRDGYRLADEDDIERALRKEKARRPRRGADQRRVEQVEQIYRGLRRNLEERGDRVGAHRWYFAEMEIGRRYSRHVFTRVARGFYRWTSGYGLSAIRAGVAFAMVALIAFLLFMVPWAGICPLDRTGGSCVGWQGAIKAVLMAVSLQSPPDEIDLAGFAGNLVWLFARFGGAAMLVSIGVAFRNQIAR